MESKEAVKLGYLQVGGRRAHTHRITEIKASFGIYTIGQLPLGYTMKNPRLKRLCQMILAGFGEE